MTDTDKLSAIEAAAAEAFKWIGLAANVHWTDPHVDEGRKNIWRSAMRKAILAYLQAIAEDEGAVEAVAEVFLMEARARHEMMALMGATYPQRAQAQVALDALEFENTKRQAALYAKAALSTLAARAQGESS